MTRLIILFTAAAAVLASAPSASAQDKIQQGSALFTSQKCVLCHAVAGKGNKKGELDEVGSKLSANDIKGPEHSLKLMRLEGTGSCVSCPS